MFVQGSIIILITQSNIEDLDNKNSVFSNIKKKQARIIVLIPDTVNPCGMSWTDPRNQALITLSEISDGALLSLQSRDILNIIFPTFLPTIYRSNILETINVGNCANDEIYVNIGSNSTVFTIVYYGKEPSVSIVDPFNNTYILPNLINSVIHFYGIYRHAVNGKYKIVGSSSAKGDNCILSIYSSFA
uniref:IgGFc-binding protein N-terminal domain-containing protein n=1 Tax=Panagrolaimus davidi TaxID=227884 RepID=A0A914PU40_9BILA